MHSRRNLARPVGSGQAPADFGRWLTALALVVAALWVFFVHFLVPVLPFDDAFITYRYAENIAAGKGAVYNEGERIFGTSTPLYLAWLTFVRFAITGIPLPDLAVRLNAIWLVLAGVGVYRLLLTATHSRLVACVGGLTLMLHRNMMQTSTGGMESFLFVALVVWALWGLSRQRAVLFGLLAGLAMLTRPEGVLLIPLGIIAYRRERSELLRFLSVCGVVVAVWVIFATVYYGTPIPHSIIAKSQPLYPLPALFGFQTVVSNITGLLTNFWHPAMRTLMVLLIWLILGCCGAAILVHTPARRGRAWGAAGFLAGIVLLYLVGNPLVFPWYWPHIFAPALVTLLIGVLTLGELGATRLENRNGGPSRVRAGAKVVAIVWLVWILAAPYARGPNPLMATVHDVSQDAERLRVLAYQQAAERINSVTGQADRVAAPEIGSFGFYFQGRVLDACGLVTPEAIPFLPVPEEQRAGPMNAAISVEFVQATNPGWVVTMPGFADRSLMVSEWFQNNYVIAGRVPLHSKLWRSSEVVILKHRDLPARGLTREPPVEIDSDLQTTRGSE